MHIGTKIRQLREERGLHVHELAQSIGRGAQTVFRWEWGRVSPKFSDLQEVARALGIDLSTLVDGVDEVSASERAPPESIIPPAA